MPVGVFFDGFSSTTEMLEVCREGIHVGRASPQAVQNGAPGWVRDGTENVAVSFGAVHSRNRLVTNTSEVVCGQRSFSRSESRHDAI